MTNIKSKTLLEHSSRSVHIESKEYELHVTLKRKLVRKILSSYHLDARNDMSK